MSRYVENDGSKGNMLMNSVTKILAALFRLVAIGLWEVVVANDDFWVWTWRLKYAKWPRNSWGQSDGERDQVDSFWP